MSAVALPISILVSSLPTNPAQVSTLKSVAACREIYAIRDQIVGVIGVDDAIEALRRTNAIERYVKDKEHKAEASYAARILETAVGAALGEAAEPNDRSQGRGGKKSIPREELISPQDAHRFRLMHQHRDIWWPVLEEEFRPDHKALARRKALKYIEAALRPRNDGSGGIAKIVVADALSWLDGISSADLLLSDPPYSTDVEDVRAFAGWLPKALSKLKPTGRALVFIGAYGDELAAYFSQPLPEGWTWGVPHAWVYRNAIGPTPEFDFVRNWQLVLSAKGPNADKLNSDRINDLLAGFIENAPDGRQDVKYHRWQKPLALAQRLIRVTTDVGGVVIDPFAGSGTHLLAAQAEGRYGSGCDIDAEAVEIALERGCDAA